MSDNNRFKPGDVLSYTPRRHHCKEATAFVRDDGCALDTYWGTYGDYEYGRLNDEEIATAVVRFNVSGYDALDEYSRASRSTWETYHPDDRGRISSQHGHREALFVRLGAVPHLDTQIENAREALEQAESKLRSAEYGVEMRRKELAELEACRVAA